MKRTEYERIIKQIETALNENVGHRINEYTGTGILTVLARQIGELVTEEAEDDLSSTR
jgi:division protein CdvB (Snf7/Vps24/ESCRT-III family)